MKDGGGERDRTDDPLLAKQVLSQLSYTPLIVLVGLVGFEPTTPALSRRCSNQLSYRPIANLVISDGLRTETGAMALVAADAGSRFTHCRNNSR